MRTLSILLLLFLIGGVAMGQSPTPEPPSGVSHDGVSPAVAGPAPAAQPTKPSVEQTLAAAHKKLEHGEPQESIAMLEQLAATAGESAKGIQHELGIAYYRTGKLLSAEKAFEIGRASCRERVGISGVY